MRYLFGIISIMLNILSFTLDVPNDVRMFLLTNGSLFLIGAIIVGRLDTPKE